jgi:hypothetical protein
MGRWLGRLLLALLVALLAGFAIGTVLRLRLERPVTYIGWSGPPDRGTALDIDRARRVVDGPGLLAGG